MAWFYDTPFNEHTGRHDLVFVNQQYDWLAGICWDETVEDYRPWGFADDESLQAVLGGAAGVTVAEYLEIARAKLPELDRDRPRLEAARERQEAIRDQYGPAKRRLP